MECSVGLSKLTNVAVAVQIAQNMYEGRSHIVSYGTQTITSAMPLNNAGSQIVFTMTASNTYTAIIVGQFEVGLVQKHYFCHSAYQ